MGVLSLEFGIVLIIFNNYSPKWRWIVVDIYRAAAAEVNNCFSIYHTSWITSGPKSNFIYDNIPTKAILFFVCCSQVNSTWLITSELANQCVQKVLFTCVVYTKMVYCKLLHWRNTTTLTTLYRDLYYALCNHQVGLNNVAKEICGKETTWLKMIFCQLQRLLPYIYKLLFYNNCLIMY